MLSVEGQGVSLTVERQGVSFTVFFFIARSNFMLLNLCKHDIVLCRAATFVSNVASMPLPLSSLSRSTSSGKHPSLRNSLRLVAKDV